MIYHEFAEIYDQLMDSRDYDKWTEQLFSLYKRYDFDPNKIFELACGTGNITMRVREKGYSIVGSDISEEMLRIATEKAMEKGLPTRFIKQDMKNINYKKKVDSVISICDGINYIQSIDDLKQVFDGVYNLLKPNGVFIFDISTIYKYEKIISNNVFTENYETFSYIWNNSYDQEKRILEFELTLFIKEGEFFSRYIENHVQKGYSVEEITDILEENFEVLGIVGAKDLKSYKEADERIYFIAKKAD